MPASVSKAGESGRVGPIAKSARANLAVETGLKRPRHVIPCRWVFDSKWRTA